MHVLIIGSLGGQIGAASQIAIKKGAKVAHADDIDGGLHALRTGQGADVVMIDVDQNVGDLVSRLESERMSIPVIACGTSTDSQSAVRAIKSGAKEFVPLPPSADLIAAVLAAISEDPDAIVHADAKMRDVLDLAEQVAPSNASVLITGSSGTGKELMARHIHEHSPRANQRFVAINCAAIPETLLESELFGHEKGAFTGAVARRQGKFEEANGGTLLLDEISEMDPRLQAKLLRAVQEREIDRLGGSKPVKVDVRIIATSNRDLQQAVADGTFREDLLFRLNVVTLALPDLAQRPADIAVLARHFIDKYADANGVPVRPLSEEAEVKLSGHAWPGNVRELENTMHRAVLLASGDRIGAEAIMLGGPGQAGDQTAPAADGTSQVGRTVAEVERDLIIDTLEHCLGNRTHAANILGISIRTLRNKLKQYMESGVAVPMPGSGERPAV